MSGRDTGDGWGTLRYLSRFRAYGRPHATVLTFGVFLRILELLADLAQPWPLAVIVDTVLGHRPLRGPLSSFLLPFGRSHMSLLTAAAVASVSLAALSGLFDYLGDRVMNGAGERMTAAIRGDLFAHMQRLPLMYHDRQAIGETVSRISVDTDRIEDALVDLFSTLLPGVLSVAGLFAVMFAVNWKLGMVAMVSVPVIAFVIYHYSRLTRQAARVVRHREGTLAGQVAEVLSGIRTIHALGAHDIHDQQFRERNRRTLAAGLRSVDLRARFTPLVETSTAAGVGVLLWVGAWGVLRGLWTLGLLLVVLTYVRNMLKPIRSLSRLSLTFSRGAASAERVAAILDEPTMTSPAEGSLRLPQRSRGELVLQHVSFSYGGQSVLNRLNLRVGAGEKVAVLGPNGAGKSSLLALVARLYDPDEGRVLLDGHPLTDVPLTWLRSQFAFVLQDTFLFSGTVWENIAYGNPRASHDAVMRAADHALVTPFARDLPEGFDTVLGDRGTGLSGGQKQRIAIARALLRDAPVVLLDEPTSGLDPEAESMVVDALQRLVAGRTVMMVTHRPALRVLADRELWMADGAIEERETPPSRGLTKDRTPDYGVLA